MTNTTILNMFGTLSELIAHAKETNSVPRIHGNGFIQLDIVGVHRDFSTRLHFWGHPRIPRQRVRTDIHDHVFSFASECLMGRLFNIRWTILRHHGGRYVVHTPQKRQGEDTALYPARSFSRPLTPEMWNDTNIIHRVNTINPKIDVLETGAQYLMPAWEFHETYAPEPAITFVTKLSTEPGVPRILVPFGQEPDNDFNRYEAMHSADIWHLIHEFEALHAQQSNRL